MSASELRPESELVAAYDQDRRDSRGLSARLRRERKDRRFTSFARLKEELLAEEADDARVAARLEVTALSGAEKATRLKGLRRQRQERRRKLHKATAGLRHAAWLDFKDMLFFKYVSVDGTPVRKKRSVVLLSLGITALVCGLCFVFVKPLAVSWGNFGFIFTQLFTPGIHSTKTWAGWWTYMGTVALPEIGTTTMMAFIATVAGGIVAIPLFIYASRNLTRSFMVYGPIRLVMAILRCFPTYVIAVLTISLLGYGVKTGVVALAIFSLGVIFKMMYEFTETIDMNPYMATLAAGGTKLQGFATAVKPQIAPMYASYMLYTFEINIRGSVVLGFVNAGGIGEILFNEINQLNFDKVGAIIVALFVAIALIQIVSGWLQRRLS